MFTIPVAGCTIDISPAVSAHDLFAAQQARPLRLGHWLADVPAG